MRSREWRAAVSTSFVRGRPFRVLAPAVIAISMCLAQYLLTRAFVGGPVLILVLIELAALGIAITVGVVTGRIIQESASSKSKESNGGARIAGAVVSAAITLCGYLLITGGYTFPATVIIVAVGVLGSIGIGLIVQVSAVSPKREMPRQG